MTDTLEIRGEKYPIETFTKWHLASLFEGFKTSEVIKSIKGQSAIGAVLKEVILPSLPDSLIKRNEESTIYVLFLEYEEIEAIFLEIMEIAKKRNVIPNDDDKDTITIKPFDDEKDQKIAELKRELETLKTAKKEG